MGSAGALPGVGNAVEKFYLDLETILQSLRQNGELHGEIPAKKLGNKAPWKARLRVAGGHIVSCQILDQRDVVVSSGEMALEALYKLDAIHWEVRPDSLENTGQVPAVKAGHKSGTLPNLVDRVPPAADPEPVHSPTPYRLVNVSLRQMNQTQWPRDYRLVYILIDGTRSISRIAEMLTMQRADVELILQELKTMRIIEINP